MPNPLDELGKQVGPVSQAPQTGSAPILQVDPLAQSMTHGGVGVPKAEPEVWAPPTPNVAKALKRTYGWMLERMQREAQPVLEKNIQLMLRGGPMAEAIAKQMLKILQEHPSEALPSPKAIEHE